MALFHHPDGGQCDILQLLVPHYLCFRVLQLVYGSGGGGAVDVLGLFPATEQGNHYVLVAMDYFTKWPAVYAVLDQSAATIAERLVSELSWCARGAAQRPEVEL